MPKLTLHHRLFLSHFLVLILGLISFTAISNLSSAHLFSRHLDSLEASGFLIQSVRAELAESFTLDWNDSSLTALAFGVVLSALLSYWISNRIDGSLGEIEQAAYQLANGHLDERVPTSEIP